MKPEFISSFQGESDYRINGKRYRVRSSAHNGPYNPGVYENEVLPAVGTVIGPDSTVYPDDAIVALFPGYVAARFIPGEVWTLEYKSPPQTRLHTLWKPNGRIAEAEYQRQAYYAR